MQHESFEWIKTLHIPWAKPSYIEDDFMKDASTAAAEVLNDVDFTVELPAGAQAGKFFADEFSTLTDSQFQVLAESVPTAADVINNFSFDS